jgi:hypothetical protein
MKDIVCINDVFLETLNLDIRIEGNINLKTWTLYPQRFIKGS